MGATDTPNSRMTQKLNKCVAVQVAAGATKATFTFDSPAPGFVWTGTLNCSGAPYNAIFTATIGNVSWGNWAGNSVYGPLQAEGGEQLVVTMVLASALSSSTSFEMCWLGSVDEVGMVAPIWPDANSSSQQTQLVGAINANISGGSLSSVGSITNPIGNNPNAPTLDQILTSSGTSFTSSYTAIYNATLTNSYSSFMVIFAGIATTGQEISVILSNSTTGETWTLSQTNYVAGQVLEFNFPIPITAGQGLLVQVSASPNITLAWQIIGYRDKNRISLANNPLDTLHVNPYGGTLRYSVQLTTGTTSTINGPTAAQYLRLHSFAVVNIASVTLTGSVTLSNPLAEDIFANLMFNMTTSNYWGGSTILDGQIVPNDYVVITNNTNRTVNVTVTYDVVQFPQIN